MPLKVLVRAGLLLLAMAAVCLPEQAQARWLRAETEQFVVYSDGDERELRNQAAKLEDFDRLLRLFHKLPVDEKQERKLEVYLVRDQKDLRRASPRVTGPISGYYMANPASNHAVGIRGVGFESVDHVLFHEYTHHFMMQHFPYPYPAWVVEGWAEFFAPTKVGDTVIEVGRISRGSVFNERWIPLNKLLSSRVGDISENERSTFYGQAWLLTHYMLRDNERSAIMTEYLRKVGAGAHPAEALEQALGRPLPEIEKALRGYANGQITYLKMTRRPQPDAGVAITRLSPAADDLLLDNLRLQAYGDEAKKDAPFLAAVASKAGKYPDDLLAQTTLARAKLLAGDLAAAEAILVRILSKDPNNLEALRLTGAARFEAARQDDAGRSRLLHEGRETLLKAMQLEPSHYPTLFAYAMSRSTEPGFPDDTMLRLFLRLRELAPQVTTFDGMAADALIRHRRYDEAEKILRLLSNNPHATGAAQTAASRLADLPRIKASRPAVQAEAP